MKNRLFNQNYNRIK